MLTKKLQKLTAFAWTSALLFAGMLLAQVLPAINALYMTFAGALVTLATAFFAGHTASQWIDAKKAEPPKS